MAAGKLALSLTDKCNLPVNTNAIPFFLAGYRSDDVTEKNAACWLLPFCQEPFQKKAPILHLPDDYQHESEGSLAHDFILQRGWATKDTKTQKYFFVSLEVLNIEANF